MDTNVPAVESGEDVAVNLEEHTMPYSKAPENSDVALFKQQISTLSMSPSTTNSAVSAEQTEELIDLSRKFNDLLGSKNATDNQQATSGVGKKLSSSLPSEVSLGKTGTQNGKMDIHNNRVSEQVVPGNMDKDKAIGYKADTSKALSSDQDNPYVAPVITPLMTHSNTIQNAGAIETNAAMIAQQIKDQVIDRILVSTNDIAANKTVKVIINPNVLQGTEVNFQKVGDILSVQFASRNEGSLQFLQVNQADLQGYLQGELKQFKGVSVSVRASGNTTDYPEDGRSRNRYEYQAPDEDEQ